MHGIKKIEDDMTQYDEIKRTIDVLMKKIRPAE
jgi:hypothetical protein